MPEQDEPQVVLRGPGEGDSIVLPMGGQRAHITRKAARTETGGHWAIGEARQAPASTTHRTRMMKQKRSTYSRVPIRSTPTSIPQRESDQAHSSSSRLAPSTGSEPVPKAGDYFASGRRPSKLRSSVKISAGRPASSRTGPPRILSFAGNGCARHPSSPTRLPVLAAPAG